MREKLRVSLSLFNLPLAAALASSKRGLVYIGNSKTAANDATIWSNNTDLSWYYNYGAYPLSQLQKSDLEYVPMLWGAPSNGDDDTSFLDSITSRKKSGENITHVLSLNEPDMPKNVGGSDVSPSDASTIWQTQMEPLKKLGIKVGAPVVSGSPIGYSWLQSWENECDGKCNPDFMPVHWYGSFGGFEAWLQNMTTTYPALEIWVTEFALPNVDLTDTQTFFNQSITMLDGWSNVTHYAYFGSFRSDSSNIGSNAAMLTQSGQLTDIGHEYLGPNATGAKSEGSRSARTEWHILLWICSLLVLALNQS